MPTQEEIDEYKERLNINRRNLRLYLKQRDQIGSAQVLPSIINGIYETRKNIGLLKVTLQSWGVFVEDMPEDNEHHINPSTPEKFLVVPFPRNRKFNNSATVFLLLVSIIIITAAYIYLVNSKHIISLRTLEANKIYMVNRENGSVSPSQQNLSITGTWTERTYIDIELPKNFRAKVTFVTENPESNFAVGIGDGTKSIIPSFAFVITPQDTAISKWFQNSGNTLYPTNLDYNAHISVKPGFLHTVVLERKDGVLRIYFDNESFIPINDDEINKLNKLFFSTHQASGQAGSIRIQDLDIEAQ